MRFDVARLLQPLPLERFLATAWQNRALALRRGNPAFYHDLMDLADVDELFTGATLRPTQVRLLRDGKEASAAAAVTGAGTADPFVDAERLLRHLRDGFTVSVLALHRSHPAILGLCRSLEDVFRCPVQANLFVTPAEARGLDRHYDTHDVFVMQLQGSKHWRIFAPVLELPLKTQPFREESHDPQAAPIEDTTLERGDLLYLPRGFPHEARSLDLSVHLTVGLKVITLAELAQHVLGAAAERDPRWRRSLPVGAFGAGFELAHLRAELRSLLEESAEGRSLEVGLDRIAAQLALDATPQLRGHLLDLVALDDELDVDAVIRRRGGLSFQLRRGERELHLLFHGKRLPFALEEAEALLYVAREPRPFRASAVPGFEEESARLDFVRRLIREGFLTWA
jgi:bifunctional lysine-specific demethylase and histidyl-hydroxylase MINA